MLDKNNRIRYKEFILSRRGNISKRIKPALEKLLEANKDIEEVYLVGSYANGDYIDETTPQWFKEFRKSFGKNREVSDIDFYTIPKVSSTKYYDVLPGFRKHSILIYKNNKILI